LRTGRDVDFCRQSKVVKRIAFWQIPRWPLLADFVAEVGDYYARGLPRFVDTSSYYAAFGER